MVGAILAVTGLSALVACSPPEGSSSNTFTFQSNPDDTFPDFTFPEATNPDDTFPDFTFPEATNPGAIPDETNPEATAPHDTSPEQKPPPLESVPATSSVVTTLPREPTDADVKACEDRVSADDVTATYADGLAMTVGKQAPVVVVLSAAGAPVHAAVTIPGATATTTKAFTQLTCEVAAQLRALNFEIDNPDKISQSFLGTDELTWSWKVTPKNTNANEINVDFYPVIRTASNELIAGQVRTATLTIAVNAADGESGGHRALAWVAGALLVALGALLVAWMVFWFGPKKDGSPEGFFIRRFSGWWAAGRSTHHSEKTSTDERPPAGDTTSTDDSGSPGSAPHP